MSESTAPVRVMLADDSSTIRALLRRILGSNPDIQVVAAVKNGEEAVQGVQSQDVDVLVLDVEMPVMDGITALPLVRAASPKTFVIMFSSLTSTGAETTIKALLAGAVDFLAKPTSSGATEELGVELCQKILVHGRRKRRVGKSVPPIKQPGALRSRKGSAPDLVVIGSSTGGPNALLEVLGGLSSAVEQPILIAQHMPPVFTTSLAKRLGDVASRPSKEGEDGERIEPGRIYVAPGDYHMTVAPGQVLKLDQSPRVNFCRPAVDPLFESVATEYGARALAVVLTGMGSDGCDGCRLIRESGGYVVVQDKESSVVWGMPGAAHSAGHTDAVVPLDGMAATISNHCSKVRAFS